ncbi:MAG: DUF4914 family protein [Phycisphaeraceae bacterium]
MPTDKPWSELSMPAHLRKVLDEAKSVIWANSTRDLEDLALRGVGSDGWAEVAFDVPGQGRVREATVCRVKNGLAANYVDPYMRRRDPESIVLGDTGPSDKTRFVDRFGYPFEEMREQTFDWLQSQDLAAFTFYAGTRDTGLPALAICPANTGFFALGLAMLQDIVPVEDVPKNFEVAAAIYVAPTFRHTHFDGRQVVVHNRHDQLHELFSYNLYPGPSAKKGVYGMLINLGEQEGFVTAHCSTVRVVTPYDNQVVFMHEGASGGGKSEMLEHAHRESDGQLLLGENTVTGERRKLTLPRECDLEPVTDDMALCMGIRESPRELQVTDAEAAWFVRVNHIDEYGVDPYLEKLTTQPPRPLLFLNIDAVPHARALIWDHVEDEPGVRCPNPRVILPRDIVPGVVDGQVAVDIRSFGVRTPPCTKEKPSYGILGLFHLLPPSLAWLWRLVAPRGHANPSIAGQATGMTSEGVGSYWPFAIGRRVDQANLLFDQIAATQDTMFVLVPNQHVGCWKVGFMPQWIAREYLARRGATPFRPEQLRPARCPLLGHTPNTIQVEGALIGHWFLQVESQPEVGEAAYDAGCEMLYDFFEQQLRKFLAPELRPEGRRIIEACLDRAELPELESQMRG